MRQVESMRRLCRTGLGPNRLPPPCFAGSAARQCQLRLPPLPRQMHLVGVTPGHNCQVIEVHQDDGARWKAGQEPRLLFVVNTGLPRLETLEDEPAKRLAHTDAPVAVAQSWAEGRRLVAGGPSAGPRLGAKRSGHGAEKMKAATRWKAVIRSRGTTGCSTSSVRPRANLAFLCKPRANLAFLCKPRANLEFWCKPRANLTLLHLGQSSILV